MCSTVAERCPFSQGGATIDTKRADAQRNRAHIVEAASAAFAVDAKASLNGIAKIAGVGAGTLYRHFPTREDLVLAVYADEVDALAAAVARSLEEHEPLDAFRIWARRLAALARIKHGLGDALATEAAQAVIDSTYVPVIAAIRQLLEAAEASGEIRPGWDPSDVLLLLSALWRVPAADAGLLQADRMLEMIIDSLRSSVRGRDS